MINLLKMSQQIWADLAQNCPLLAANETISMPRRPFSTDLDDANVIRHCWHCHLQIGYCSLCGAVISPSAPLWIGRSKKKKKG